MGKRSRKTREARVESADTSSGSRSEARRQQRAAEGSGGGRSFLDRYRNVLVGAIAIVGVGLVGYMVFSSSTASAYSCDSLLQAPEIQLSPPLSGETEDRLGFPVGDEGATHTNGSTSYLFCPPTSGEHRGGGALQRDFYGPDSIQVPNNWVHNLEHGYAIIAYRGEPEQDVLDQVRDAMDAPAPTEVAQACGLPNKVIALRFDDISEPFAILAWRQAYLMDAFDPELATTIAEQFQDQPQAPERAC